MGSYVFRWPYPADDVHVTGTFDDWGKSEQLNKVGDIWEKEVVLPSADEKVLYKFVVNDKWIVDESAPTEGDGHNNVNNVLLPEHIKRIEITSQAPGAFPETPSAEQTFSVQPIPATDGLSNPVHLAPGEKVPDAKDITTNTIASGATTSKEDYEKFGQEDDQTVSVNPIPASAGYGNPVQLAPGQPIPNDANTNAVESAVTTSKEDYEKAGQEPDQTVSVNPIPASAGFGNPVSLAPGEAIPPTANTSTIDSTVTTSQEDYEKAGSATFPAAVGAGAAALGVGGIAAATAFKKPEAKENLIPESSLPIGGDVTDTLDRGPFISSTAPGTSAAELAAKVPLETNTTGPFLSSAGPGTTTSELASKVPLEQAQDPTITSSGPGTTSAELASKVPLETQPDPTISSAAPGTSAAALAGGVPLEQKRQGMVVDPKDVATSAVPETVQKSIGQAHQDPEAAASAEAVREKTDVEKELLSKVKPSEATGAPASAADAQSSYHGLATTVPETVEQSMAKANAPPEAAADASVVAEKTGVEQELLSKVPVATESGQPAPTITAASTTTAPTSTSAAATAPTGPSSDLVSDATLAQEPAVQMMQQNETTTAATSGTATATATDGIAPAAVTGAASGVPTVTDVGTGAAATAGTTTTAATKPTVATESAPSTPSKKTAPAEVASPASTAGTDKSKKKHKHRLSAIWKKLVH